MRVASIFSALCAVLVLLPSDVAAKSQPQVEYPAYHGPKKTIAVSKFDANGAFVAHYGGWDIGGGLAAMLAVELDRTNRFIVVERADLDTLLREKQMALSDVTTGDGGRRLLGAQTFIRGSVTEFEQVEKGGGLSIGIGFNGGQGGAGTRQASGHVTIELRLVDADTGTILASSRVDKIVKSSSLALKGKKGLLSFGGDEFNQTSLGTASREAIQEAVAQIIRNMESVPWQGLVARSDGDRIYVNAGRDANIERGNRMRVIRAVDTITDPQTGEVLGGRKETIADLVIDQVDERYSIGRLMDAGQRVERGDIVQLIGQ